MRKVLPFFLGIFLVVVVGAYWVLNYTGSNKDLATGSPYLITVEPGMTTADIANLLHKQKLVKTPEALDWKPNSVDWNAICRPGVMK